MFINIEFHLSLCFYSECLYFCKTKPSSRFFFFFKKQSPSSRFCFFNPKTYFVHIYVSNRYVEFFIGYNLYWEKDIEEYLYLKFHFLFEFLYAE